MSLSKKNNGFFKNFLMNLVFNVKNKKNIYFNIFSMCTMNLFVYEWQVIIHGVYLEAEEKLLGEADSVM